MLKLSQLHGFNIVRHDTYNNDCDPYWANVILLARGEDYTDSSGHQTLTNSGSTIVSGQFTNAYHFDGLGNIASNSIALATGIQIPETEDWTAEGWFNDESGYGTFYVRVTDVSVDWIGCIDDPVGDPPALGTILGDVDRSSTGLNDIASITGVSAGWHHFAVVNDQVAVSGNKTRVYIDGNMIAHESSAVQNWPLKFKYIGWDNKVGYPFLGKLEELRVTQGVARYANNFTPPNAPFFDVSC